MTTLPIMRPLTAVPLAPLPLKFPYGRLLLLSVLLGVLFLLSLALGSVNIPLPEIITVLLGGEASKTSWTQIITQLRLPKALTAVLAGAALSVSGLLMQTFFRNPLADPFVLGISSGASLGVALVVLSLGTVGGVLLAGIGLTGDLLLIGAAAVGAGLTLLLVLVAARHIHSHATLLVMGLMFGYLTSALVTLLLHFTIKERIQVYFNWSSGNFGGVTWGQMPLFIPIIGVGLLVALFLAKPLNALLLGETYARSMGVNLRVARFGIITATALLAGTVTAFCGPVGFIGVAVPHVCRAILRTVDHRTLLPASMLMGSSVALFAALIADLPGSNLVLPLNAITALLGAPIVLWVLLRTK
jgi:iron complex transport system permease protein